MTIDESKGSTKFAEQEIIQEHQLKEKIVNEEFKIWKKTVPLLYDTIQTQAIEYPSLSIKWLPDYTVAENKNSITVRFLFGSNTSSKAQDTLLLASVSLPSTLAPDFSKFSSNDNIPIPLSDAEGAIKNSFKVLSTWNHPGEVNKFAIEESINKAVTFDRKGIVHLYDYNASTAPVDFKYHKKEGFALEWTNSAHFLSGANDSQIALWDINKPSTPFQLFKSHNGAINDLSHNKKSDSIFASVSDDYSTQIHDLRLANMESNPAINLESSHIQNAVEFHPDVATLIATGGKDNIVSLYDLRNTSQPVRKLFGHSESVIGLKWDKYYDPSSLISWGLDSRVIVWDLDQLDEPFSYPTDQDGSKKKSKQAEDPCLKFVHGGHTNRINDVDIHPKIKSLFVSVGDDNLVEVWKPKTIVIEDEEDEDEEEETKENEEKEDVEMK